jgi:uncharacterized protein (DUF488 family)
MNKIQLYTIGFTKKTAQTFFNLLQTAGVQRVIDVRFNNNSQYAGFAKQENLEYFLHTICGIKYLPVPELAPTKAILNDYKKRQITWITYEEQFLALMQERKMAEKLSPTLFHQSCLLCSEDRPKHCHRRLVAEYLNEKWGNVRIVHL